MGSPPCLSFQCHRNISQCWTKAPSLRSKWRQNAHKPGRLQAEGECGLSVAGHSPLSPLSLGLLTALLINTRMNELQRGCGRQGPGKSVRDEWSSSRKVLYSQVFELPFMRISSKNVPLPMRFIWHSLLLSSPAPLGVTEVTLGNRLLTRPKVLLPEMVSWVNPREIKSVLNLVTWKSFSKHKI